METQLARALTMRVYEAKLVYSLVSLGEDIRLDRPAKVADYLRSAFEEHPMQEAFFCVYLDRKNHPLGRHLITLGTVDSTLVSAREVFRGAILAGASGLIVAHNLCAAAHRLCYVASRTMWSDRALFGGTSLCVAA